MGIWTDLKVLYDVNCRPIRGDSHQERLESFYTNQAEVYDAFRENFLHGRRELWQRLPTVQQGVWVDLGGGTGSNLEYIADKVCQFRKIYLVDLATSLTRIAQRRIAQHGWHNVEIVHADATTFMPPEGMADLVTFSYSLTMIPNWFAAIENANRILHRDGVIAAVDFYVTRKYPVANRPRSGWFTRHFWPWFFARDNVFLSPDHLPYLESHFKPLLCEERRVRVPYIPWLKVPIYLFLGRKIAFNKHIDN